MLECKYLEDLDDADGSVSDCSAGLGELHACQLGRQLGEHAMR